MSTLKLKNINKIYPNGFHAVHDFNMEISDGEFIVLVGPSGCGKSTTLRMIAGLEDITGGEFLIDGKLANELGPRARGISMVFQSYALYPHLTVYDNLAFGLKMAGLNVEIIEKRVQRIAKMLGLDPYLDRFPRALSGGQRQRVAVGRAIIRQVEVFLMDEPLSNLDAKQRVTMRSEIISIHRKIGATSIYVTHDQTEAMTMADRIVVMKDGYVQQIGTPKELYFTPCNLFVAGFIGEPPMNLIDANVDGCKVCIGENASFEIGKSFERIKDYDGKEIVLGFRPEAIELKKEDESVDFTATVTLTEMLGDNVNVYCKLGEKDIILKVSPYDEVKVGENVDFCVPDKLIYFFDKETGKVI